MPAKTPEDFSVQPFRDKYREALIKLWVDCELVRPWNDPELDIDRKMAVQAESFLIGFVQGKLCASAMAGYDGHRGWINYLAVAPAYRHRGYGRLMMAAVEQTLMLHGCPKLNLQVRAGNDAALAFYEKLGYTQDPVISLGKRLIDDDN